MSRNLRTVKLIGDESHPETKRVTVDATIAHQRRKVVTVLNLQINRDGPGATPSHLSIPMNFNDVCALRTLLEDVQRAHADAQAALEAADLEG